MSRYKFKYIWIEIYGINVYWVQCERSAYNRLVKNIFDTDAPEKRKMTAGTFEVFEKDGQNIGVLWFSKSKNLFNLEHISHEAFHAAHWILSEQGLWLTDSSEEAYAYLIELIVGRIIKKKSD